MGPLTETGIVLEHELRRGLRSPKTLVLLLLYGLATLLSGLVFVAATRTIQRGLAAAASSGPSGQLPPEALAELKMGGLALIFGEDPETLRHLAQIPLVVVFFFKLALFALPLLVVLIGFDQLSSELQTRSLRYSVQRSRRGSILAGKVLAQAALLLGLTAIVNLAIYGYAAVASEGFAAGRGLAAMGLFWLLAAAYASMWLGLTALCSALFRTPVTSLLVALCAIFGFWLLSLMARLAEGLAWLAWLTPAKYENGLVSPHPLVVLGSLGAYAAFAAVFLTAAGWVLRRRDL